MPTTVTQLWATPKFAPGAGGGGFSLWWTVETDAVTPVYNPQWATTELGDDGWQDLLVTPTSGMSCTGVGPKRHALTDLPYFRLQVLDASTSPATLVYTTSPTWVKVGQDKHDWLLWREMVRRQALGLTKYQGTPGVLLSRREYGTPCTTCLDEVLGGVSQSNCPTCHGTGVVGGWYPPQPVWGDWETEEPEGRDPSKLETVGVSDVVKTKVLTAWSPYIKFKDVWVDVANNYRYEVQVIDRVQFRGWPISQVLDVSLLPVDDPAYALDITLVAGQTPASVTY